jgi:DNA repair protein RadC
MPSIRELPEHDRPRSRIQHAGGAALSDAELLAILLRDSGVEGMNAIELAQQLLVDHRGWAGLQRANFADLAVQRGMGQAKVAQIKAALEIGRRLLLTSDEQRLQIRSPADAAQLMLVEMGQLDQEHLRTICLDTKNRVQKIQTVYIGSLNSSLVRIGELYKEAIRLNSAAVIYVRWNITLKRHTLPKMEHGSSRDLKERSAHEHDRLGTLRPRDPPTTRPCLAHHARQPWVGPQYPHCLCGRP